jgi:putative membrane protein
MKTILRNTTVYSFSLFILSLADSGVKVQGGFPTYLAGGFALCLLFMILKPILGIVSLPLNLVTLGMFSFLINSIILYLMTAFVSQIKIQAFVFEGLNLWGFIIPKMGFNTFFAFIVSAMALSIIVGVISWLIKR